MVPEMPCRRRIEPEIARNPLLICIGEVARNTLLILASGVLGACMDEVDHAGPRMLLSLCASGAIPMGRSILLQLQLVPTAILGMLGGLTLVIGVQTLPPRSHHRGAAGRIGTAAAHFGCMGAMLTSFTICTYLIRGVRGFFQGALIMLGTDAVVSISISLLAVMAITSTLPKIPRPTPVGSK